MLTRTSGPRQQADARMAAKPPIARVLFSLVRWAMTEPVSFEGFTA
jgi:hypothetical protein